VGACGGVGTTIALGLAALGKKLADTTSLVTELPLFEGVSLVQPGQFVVGGHEIREAGFRQTASEMHERAGVFHESLLAACSDTLEAWEKNLRPGTLLACGETIAKLSDRPGINLAETPAAAIERIKADLLAFKKEHNLDDVVVLSVASTEPPFPTGPEHQSLALLEPLLSRANNPVLPASSLYAYAALDLGLPYVNFTPCLGATMPALEELAIKRGTVIAGKDGKTGETLMKTVLAPMFHHRNWRILSWVGHNIFGNRDGVVLDDPRNKAAKVGHKDAVVSSIVGYKPNTLVSIEYIPSMDDWKTAWNHIHFQGFLGTKMILQFIWQGCDSLLAAPLAIDLARMALLARSRKETGVLSHLSCFFKGPQGCAENDFFKQFIMLEEYVTTCRDC
jgi:myo-inositol-1-phosphate synthase